MSQEMALAFIEEVNRDSRLQTKLITQTGNMQGLIRVAAEAGYRFTTEDWRAVIRRAASHEMNEDELELVVGAGTQTENFLSDGFNWSGLVWDALNWNSDATNPGF
jgi:predicted ribosomally synthesized peptide with nif11-like leader